jgi:hypothetical protein
MTHDTPTPPEPDDALLTINEAAEILRSYVDTLRYWRHLGIGPRSFKIGRRIFYWRSEVYRWLREQEAATAGVHRH